MPTLAQTPAEKAAYSTAATGRMALALRELRRRLKEELPPQIDYYNATLGLTALEAYQVPKDYLVGPIPVDDRFIRTLIIDHSLEIVHYGTRNFRIEATVSVFVPDKRVEAENQILDASDRGAIIATVLYQYLNGCDDVNDVRVWNSLVFMRQTVLPEYWKAYSGICLTYKMVQNPPANQWSVK